MKARRATTALLLSGIIVGMLGLTAAAVPIYRMFCQATGYGGTTRRAEQAPEAAAGGRTIKVRFNAAVAQGMPWSFAPEVREVEARIGEQHLAFFRAHNNSTRPIIGTATFNVTPDKASYYFVKTECFCFTEQVLKPGESADMPVSFFVDPAILDDIDTRDLQSLTLSYTFFPRDDDDQAEAKADGRPSS